MRPNRIQFMPRSSYLLDHQLCDALTVALVIEPNTVDSHCKYKDTEMRNDMSKFHV